MKSKCLYTIFTFLFIVYGYSQDTININKIEELSINKASSKVISSLKKNKNDEVIAKEYINLARELMRKKEYSKAEEYLERAKNLYSKRKNKKEAANLSREVARIQELQSNYKGAINNYDEASRYTTDPTLSQINSNDANRLRNSNAPLTQSNYIYQNIELAEKQNLEKEKVESYRQLAEINFKINRKESAVDNLENALKNNNDKTTETEIKRQLAKIYASENQINKAVNINKQLIEEAKKTNDSKTEIEQLQLLSHIYLENDNESESIILLNQAYNLAMEKGETWEAKKSLEKLAEIYEKQKKSDKSIDLYKDFLSKLENLIKSDTSLVDIKLFQGIESKINQLEKEKELQKELIKKKNIITYFLIVIIIFIIIFTFSIIRALYFIKKKNKKIALQSLRREMNPHFIFNSLNSVNQFIANNDELEANRYLTSYSKLMRNVMENSNKDFIRLSDEIDLLTKYLDLEQMRFVDKFDYTIKIDPDINTESIYVPNMLIQPNLENAIWHGLRYKEKKGRLEVSILEEENNIIIKIEDNGIGIEQSHKFKTENQKLHLSRGLNNIRERIRLLNSLYNINIGFKLIEKREPDTGSIIELIIPKKIKIIN